ncbi:hypothetical protein [Providencia sp. PROV036]|uniref:hypothetical protein n=1 Tax=Providencia sp. PROV036 TaxID=2949767 RepID=UPI0023497BF0|nr:hypothetical protein [Providencia sp. PROV036]
MKILLLGEFSGFHAALQDGLKFLGHDVTLISSGDGWKKLQSDILLGQGYSDSLYGKIKRNLEPYIKLKNFVGYDIVQLVNVKPLNCSLLANYFLIKLLKKYNNKIVLSASGTDAYFWRNNLSNYKYPIHADILKYDNPNIMWQTRKAFSINKKIVNIVDKIIPIMYEYQNAYKDINKISDVIPLPINLQKIPYTPNEIKGKLMFFHGINRPGIKGTKYITQAFDIAHHRYKNVANFVIANRMPYEEYSRVISSTNVIADQCMSYSCGMNALQAMASGKIVMGGAEKEGLEIMKIDNSPVFNITPDPEQILNEIDAIINDKNNITELGYLSRKYIEQHHDCIKIANIYLQEWNNI